MRPAAAGAVPARLWNAIASRSSELPGSAPPFVLDDGTQATGVELRFGRTEAGAAQLETHDEIDPQSENERLFDGFLGGRPGDELFVELRGLAGHFETYDLYVYVDGDARYSRAGGVQRISDGATWFTARWNSSSETPRIVRRNASCACG